MKASLTFRLNGHVISHHYSEHCVHRVNRPHSGIFLRICRSSSWDELMLSKTIKEIWQCEWWYSQITKIIMFTSLYITVTSISMIILICIIILTMCWTSNTLTREELHYFWVRWCRMLLFPPPGKFCFHCCLFNIVTPDFFWHLLNLSRNNKKNEKCLYLWTDLTWCGCQSWSRFSNQNNLN